MLTNFEPLIKVTRGDLLESVHYGALTICDAIGGLRGFVGDPELLSFLRSSAKPFQAIPLLESGAAQHFGLTPQEIALTCSSHSGTDEHVAIAASIQSKAGIGEEDLLCGVHAPYHCETARRLEAQGLQPTPNRNNCSGKHSGMLAFAKYSGYPLGDYVSKSHPIQLRILETLASMCDISPEEVSVAVDGCSVPTFAVPLRSAARAYARLMDPAGLPRERARACREIVQAMTRYPQMVGGPERFDTRLMEVTDGRLLSKGGAEGYQAIGIPPGALGPDAPAMGMTLKIADGDLGGRARSVVTLDVLNALGAISDEERDTLAQFDARPLINHRGVVVGEIRADFRMEGSL
jgi:L-asparaginase II